MKQRALAIFLGVVSALIGAILWFIQSSYFATIIKTSAVARIPSDLGIAGDFSDLAIKLFPPGLSIRNPKITLKPKNALGLPGGSSIAANRIDLNFRPLQMFSGKIRVHEVAIEDGQVTLYVDPNANPTKPARRSDNPFSWDDLFQIQTDGILVTNTHVNLESLDKSLSMSFNARRLKVEQWTSTTQGYQLELDILALTAQTKDPTNLPQQLDEIRGAAKINPTGLWMENLTLTASGITVTSEGSIRGNLLSAKELPIEAKIKATGNVPSLLKLLTSARQVQPRTEGTVVFAGTVKGDLLHVAESFKAEGEIKGDNLKYQDWFADHAEAKAAWISSASGGGLEVFKAAFSSEPRARIRGQSASGGKVTLGNFKINLGKLQAFTLPVQLEKAHIHWLAAGVIGDVYPLDTLLDGGLELTFTPGESKGKSWSLRASTDLSATSFQLDNQEYRKLKAPHRILKIPHIDLDGIVDVDSSGIHFGNGSIFTLALPNSKLTIAGDIDFKTGFDFTGDGPIQLGDLGEIAETPIRGNGSLHAHIHGPTSALFMDFDCNLTDGYYLSLNLGSLKGRIQYDDAASKLNFINVALKKGTTPYLGEGTIDLGPKDSIRLNFDIPSGNIQDLIQIFHEQTSDIWWFPSSLAGSMRGKVKITGGLSMDQLKAWGNLTGTGWEYWGERFRNIEMTGGYDKGDYIIESFKSVKKSGRIAGSVAYGVQDTLQWNFSSNSLSVLDIDHFAQLDVPMRGELILNTSGKGKIGALSSDSRFSLNNYSVRGTPLPSSQLDIQTDHGRITANGHALGSQALLNLQYDFKPTELSRLDIDCADLDFSPILFLLNPKLTQETELQALLSGHLAIGFKSGSADRGSGKIDINKYVLAKKGSRLELERPTHIDVKEGSFAVSNLKLVGTNTDTTFNLVSKDTKLDGAISGTIGLSILEFLTSVIGKADGSTRLDVAIGGTIKEPSIFGNAQMEKATLSIAALESPFENITGSFRLKQNVLSVLNIDSELASGHISAKGTIELFPNRYPTLQLTSAIRGSRLKVFPFQFIKVFGDLNVTGSELPYLVEGKMQIDSALSKEKMFNQHQSEGLKSAEYLPSPTRQNDSAYPRFRLNIQAKAEKNIIIQNELFDAEAKGDLTVVNTLDTPRIIGNAEVIQGKVVFKNRVFQIKTASAVFDSPTVINPSFDLTANTDVNNVNIQLYVNGRMDKFKIELTSNPTMPESDIFSLLAMGISPAEVKKLNPNDRSAVEQGEAASLLLHSLDFNREVENKTGFKIQLSESVDAKAGQSITKPPSSLEAGAAPKIVIKRQIGNNLDLSVGSTVGIGTNTRQEVNAEYRVTPGFSVIGVYDNYETIDAQERKSYGMDLKFQKRFGK